MFIGMSCEEVYTFELVEKVIFLAAPKGLSRMGREVAPML
jgi:hypothetical protein